MQLISLTSICILALSLRLTAQAPLVTDDAAVAAARAVHVELFGQFAGLPASVRPATAQHTLVLTMGYGVGSRLEVGFDFPLIAIVRPPQTVLGTGDLNVTAKYMLRAPADALAARFAVAGAVEVPTGDVQRGFGSGVADYNVNLIGEWRRGPATTLRLNGGVQFAGNTLTGLIGSPDRGVVLSAGGSAEYAVTPRLALAGELTGYQGRSASAVDRELRTQGALSYALSDAKVLAVSLQRGWFASPRWTLQVGVAFDWERPHRAK